MKAKITQALVERLQLPARGSDLYADQEMRGFYLILTPTKRSYYAQTLVNGRQVRVRIGEHPTLNAKEAREQARQVLARMKAGTNPNEEKRRERIKGMTFKDALELHLGARERTDRTEESYRYVAERYLTQLLTKPLADIGADRSGVRELHRKLTESSGRTTADYAMRIVRAVYNRGLREHPELPPNPTANVDFHGQQRRQVITAGDELHNWARAALALQNSARRDLHLFLLLSGMRRTATVQARWEHFDEGRAALRVPLPKGGASRAFDLPLSAPLLDLLRSRAAQNEMLHPRSPWIFPSDGRSGHIEEVKEKTLGRLTGHALRHVYATSALEAGIGPTELKFLLNHSRTGDVTLGYLSPSLDFLRQQQERASAHILSKLDVFWTPGQWPPCTERLRLVHAAE